MYTITGTDKDGKRHSINTEDYKHAMSGAGVVVKGAVWTNHIRNGKSPPQPVGNPQPGEEAVSKKSHALEKIRREAKKRVKDGSPLTYMQQLEAIAKEQGFESWADARNKLGD